MPNQEKVINRAESVTYLDNPANVWAVLLPNGESMQAYFAPTFRNSLWV